MNETKELVSIAPSNFPLLKNLVEQQASHHGCIYRGDDAYFLSQLIDPRTPPRVLMAQDRTTQDPLGYVLYNETYTLKGKELYIEDILVRQDIRSQGVGRFFFDELQKMGEAESYNAVSWVVARDNDQAIRFYVDKVKAKASPYTGFDCVEHLRGEFNFAAHGQTVVPMNASLLKKLEESDECRERLSDDKLANLKNAIGRENAIVFIAQDNQEKPLALLVANSNFSSFRTVYGYKVELQEIAHNDNAALQGFSALLGTFKRHALTNNHIGHLNLFVSTDSLAQQQFAQDIKAPPFMMSDSPNSYLDMYSLRLA